MLICSASFRRWVSGQIQSLFARFSDAAVIRCAYSVPKPVRPPPRWHPLSCAVRYVRARWRVPKQLERTFADVTTTDLLTRLNDQRIAAVQTARGIADRMSVSDTPNPRDEAAYRKATEEIDRLSALAKDERRRVNQEHDDSEAIGYAERRAGMGTGNMSLNTEARYNVPLPEGRRFTDLPDADKRRNLDDFGSYTRSLLLNEQRAQSEGVSAEGGALVPTAFAAPILDLAVNAMQVRRAGARIIPMDSKTTQIGRLEADPTPQWRAEAAAIAESAGVFGAVTLTAKSMAVYVKCSLELLEDANPAFGTVLGTALARAFALEGDRVALYGTGTSNMPRGVKNTSGVAITPLAGVNGGIVNEGNGNYGPVIQTVGRLKARNYQPSGLLYSPRTETSFAGLTDTSGQPLAMPDYLKNIPQYVTGQIPNNLTVGTSTDASDVFAGDWSNLLIGMRTDFRILPLNERFLVESGSVGFVGWMRLDVQLARADAFEVLSGVRS